MSRARRLRERSQHGRIHNAPRTLGASDEVSGLGRVEQLVLRGDGLTTTSLQILTGHRIDVTVTGHWRIAVPEASASLTTGDAFAGLEAPDVDEYLAAAFVHLNARAGDVLLVRSVLLVGSNLTVYGSADVIALLDSVPESVAGALATTNQPIGRLLQENGVMVKRELRRWGFVPAGSTALHLGPGLVPTSRVPGRTYVMRLASTDKPLAVLTERFSPRVFA